MQPSSTQANGSLERNEFLTPLVNQWIQRIETARMAKKPWQDIADQCKAFFSKDCGFMWEPTFKANFIGSSLNNPKFEITIAKAFELVAVFGPYLFWKYPNRYIKTNEPIELRPEFFGPPQDPMVQQQFQMAMQQMQMEQSAQQMRNKVMEKYLNYSQREQPDGLDRHAELAITDALVKGRGLLWVEGYSFPGSGRKLTGCFHGSPDDLFIDPDCKDPTLRAAKWIARRHVSDREELERKFGYPPGTLFRRGHFESMESRSVNMPNSSRTERSQGELDDRVVWYEVWSKQGIGSRKQYGTDGAFTRLNDQLHDQFDQVVGDYAYLCVCDNVPFPLNAPSYMVENSTNEQVQEMFRWRASNYGPEFPTYLDERWPVAVLDFYRNPDSCWPIAPLAPGLGELICLNVLMSAFVEQGYENRKSIIAVLDSAAKDVEAQIRGTENPAIVRINETAHNNITSMIQYLNRPNMNTDIVNVINYVSMMFDKRTGLSEIMYAMNVGGVQSRSARDIAAKEEKAAIRPEKMSADVARWMTDAAQLEKFLAGWTVSGRDLVPLLGQHGSMLWLSLIHI